MPSLTITNEFSHEIIFDAIRQHKADVCVLDPLVALHDADENSNAAMRAVLDILDPIAEETGCTFIIAHHEPKAPENNSAASRGASAIRDWCRTMLRLTAQKLGPDGSRRFQLDLDKANYGGTVWQLTLERKQDSYIFTPIEPEAVVAPRDIWELLGADGRWFDEVQDQVMERFQKLGQDEPLDVLLSWVRVCGYIAMVLTSLFEKRDNTDRWEKQLLQLEGIIADLNDQLQEARSPATVRRQATVY
jgi:hypothetical protein